jgi:putative SOS response-associated peptidase YedK
MCGHVRLSSDVSEIKLVFSIPPHRPTPNFPPSWNAAPTDLLPAVRYDARAGERSLDLLRWGLVPYWAKDLKVGFANINAKAEGIEDKPAFREAFQRRRCLVPVDNFYEWKKTASGKQPYAIALADSRLMALAGLWEAIAAGVSVVARLGFPVPPRLQGDLHAANFVSDTGIAEIFESVRFYPRLQIIRPIRLAGHLGGIASC